MEHMTTPEQLSVAGLSHRVIVSGVTGHLGREVARQLACAGVEVHGFTRRDLSDRGSIHPAIEIHRMDVHYDDFVRQIVDIQPDTIFHLAALYRRDHSTADIETLISANILVGAHLLEGARLAGCRRFITAGTYFQHFGPDESDCLNLYAATKQSFEVLLAYYANAYRISAAALTLYEIYSEHDIRPKLMTRFADALQADHPLLLPDYELYVDLLHVQDVAAAFVVASRMLGSDASEGARVARYSVCSGYDTTASKLIDLFEKLSGRRLAINTIPAAPPARRISKPWRGEVVPGWTPAISLLDGICRIMLHRGIQISCSLSKQD
jgi:nucleoside-diphosphate-sugar epimerase